MKFLPSLNTLKTTANYAALSVAAGAVLGVPYFAFMAKISASAFTAAQAAAAQTYGATLVGTYAAAVSFSSVQLAIAVGYGAVASVGIFAASKLAKFAYDKVSAKFAKKTPVVLQPIPEDVGAQEEDDAEAEAAAKRMDDEAEEGVRLADEAEAKRTIEKAKAADEANAKKPEASSLVLPIVVEEASKVASEQTTPAAQQKMTDIEQQITLLQQLLLHFEEKRSKQGVLSKVDKSVVQLHAITLRNLKAKAANAQTAVAQVMPEVAEPVIPVVVPNAEPRSPIAILEQAPAPVIHSSPVSSSSNRTRNRDIIDESRSPSRSPSPSKN